MWNSPAGEIHSFNVCDDPIKADRVEKLLDLAAKGEKRLMTTEMVIAEVVWVLESFYKLDSNAVGPMVKAILATPGLEVINSGLVEKVVEHYMERSIDFIDGCIVTVLERQNVSEIFSYDRNTPYTNCGSPTQGTVNRRNRGRY